jgi:hypothetical protein
MVLNLKGDKKVVVEYNTVEHISNDVFGYIYGDSIIRNNYVGKMDLLTDYPDIIATNVVHKDFFQGSSGTDGFCNSTNYPDTYQDCRKRLFIDSNFQKDWLANGHTYNSVGYYACLAATTNYETLTLDTAPSSAWNVGDIITGISSGATAEISYVTSTTSYRIIHRTAAFTLGEVLQNQLSVQADQGASYPTVSTNISCAGSDEHFILNGVAGYDYTVVRGNLVHNIGSIGASWDKADYGMFYNNTFSYLITLCPATGRAWGQRYLLVR